MTIWQTNSAINTEFHLPAHGGGIMETLRPILSLFAQNREHFFGEIMNVDTPSKASAAGQQTTFGLLESNSMTPCMASLQQTEIGKIAEQEWLKTFSLRPDMHLGCDEFIVMPNHFHAIIHIGENDYNRDDGFRRYTMHGVSDIPESDSSPDMDITQNPDAMHGVSTGKFGPQFKNLSSVIRGYKSAVTTFARKNNIIFDWQPRFHDHIIREGKSYHTIKNYILNNPSNWNKDTFNK